MFDHFNLLAPIYDRLIQAPDVAQIIDLLQLPVMGNLLEAGGGTGRVSYSLHSELDDLFITDIAFKMLQKAKEKKVFHVSLAQTEALPYSAESFERVLVVDALHHFREQELAISELLRVLKAGGRMVIEEPDINHFPVKLVALAEKMALMRSHFCSPEQICDYISKIGYSPEIVSDNSITSWIVVDK